MQNKLSEPLDEFKEREVEIINLMAEGLSNQDIADQLFITKETVRWYNKQIYSKLGTSRRTEAIALAREMGLISDPTIAIGDTHEVLHTLPITTGPFIGRDSDLIKLSEIVTNPDIRLVSIIAAGGMGKSRLSLELGHGIKGNYEHGAVFIDLTPVRNADDIAKVAIASMNLSVSSHQSSEDILFNYCREKELLLIFDNFEHILSGASLLSDILAIAARISIIVTSRERLNLRKETTYYLQPIAEHGDKLFSEVASMLYPHISINPDEQTAVRRITELVGGSPLALIIAATWLDALSVTEIADEIEANLEFLSAEMGDMPERQRSIHSLIDPTWKRLNETEQKAFMWASVFRGGFTRETLQQVSGASIRNIQTLLNRSLITHGYGRRYDMHPLLRQYAREKLEMAEALVDARKAHLETFLAYAQNQADRMYDGQHYLESLEALDIEQDNFRAALDWSLKGYNTHHGISLILTLCDFWATRSQRIEAVYYLEHAVQHEQKAALYERLGAFQDRLGKPDSAEVNRQKAINLATEANQPDILARAYRLIGSSIHATNIEEALKFYQHALAINQELKLSREAAHCYVHLGLYHYEIEDKRHEALDYLQKAIAIYEKLGDLQGISIVIYNMGLIYHKDGHSQHAREYYERSLTIKQQIGDRAGVARRLNVLAGMAIMEEEFEQAIAFITESRKICEEIGDLQRLGEVLSKEGFMHLIIADYGQAQTVLEKGLEIALSIKNYSYVIRFYSYIGLHFLVQEKVQAAKSYIMKALLTDTATSRPPWVSIIAYANILWYDDDFDPCLLVTSTLFLHQKDADEPEMNKYFLEPLVYRVQSKFGDGTWKQALDTASGSSVEQVFQQIVGELLTK